MNPITPDQSAFPDDLNAGLTKREHFAAIIHAALAGNSAIAGATSDLKKGMTEQERITLETVVIPKAFAACAVAHADALIERLNKP